MFGSYTVVGEREGGERTHDAGVEGKRAAGGKYGVRAGALSKYMHARVGGPEQRSTTLASINSSQGAR